ncbi:MAG: DUF1559 domain-containing protein, partial [Planctomycetaceae bacterium]|nr:DUF1559 domain-containing protein [Planctomycetaceae bacterium]
EVTAVTGSSCTNVYLSAGDGMWTFARRPDQETNAESSVGVRGFFQREVCKTMSYVKDGTSNTIALSEGKVPVIKDTDIIADGGVALVGTINSSVANAKGARDVCLSNGYNATDKTRVSTVASSWRGRIWSNGRASESWFTTTLAPNSISCAAGDGSHAYGTFSPSSYHTGGVQVLFADGSIHFVSNTIDVGSFSMPQVAEGKSNFGVWGALGSMVGGESKSL